MGATLVTGATGQDGSYLVDRLVAEGHEVVALCRPGGESTARLSEQHPRVGILLVDLADSADVAAAVRGVAPSTVFHLAALSSVAASWQDPQATGLITGVGAAAVMQGALAGNADARVVLASSAEIFAGRVRERYDESSEIAPGNPYGAAKAYAHLVARMLREQGAHVSAAILFNHESPRRGTQFVTRKITSTAAALARGEATEMALGNLEARRDWGWAPDYVDAMVAAASHQEPGEYVVATGESHSVKDFAMAALAAAGLPGREDLLRVDPTLLRSGDAPTLVGDASRARDVLGWRPTVTFEQIVAAMVRADLDR